jgi:hypothetical protein
MTKELIARSAKPSPMGESSMGESSDAADSLKQGSPRFHQGRAVGYCALTALSLAFLRLAKLDVITNMQSLAPGVVGRVSSILFWNAVDLRPDVRARTASILAALVAEIVYVLAVWDFRSSSHPFAQYAISSIIIWNGSYLWEIRMGWVGSCVLGVQPGGDRDSALKVLLLFLFMGVWMYLILQCFIPL